MPAHVISRIKHPGSERKNTDSGRAAGGRIRSRKCEVVDGGEDACGTKEKLFVMIQEQIVWSEEARMGMLVQSYAVLNPKGLSLQVGEGLDIGIHGLVKRKIENIRRQSQNPFAALAVPGRHIVLNRGRIIRGAECRPQVRIESQILLAPEKRVRPESFGGAMVEPLACRLGISQMSEFGIYRLEVRNIKNEQAQGRFRIYWRC